MDRFSITQLSRYSGIKAHTIRIWEQRYRALTPHRSEGNTRYYDGNHLRRLLNIVSLMDEDRKISELGGLSDPELFALVEEKVKPATGNKQSTDYYVSQLIAAGMTYDNLHFEKTFSSCMRRYSMVEVYKNIIYPLLVRVGLMWSGDNMPPANEHFITNMLRQKLFASIDTLPPPNTDASKWLLFLQEDEFHELGILLAHYLVRASGNEVIYLGCHVPFESVISAFNSASPDYALTFIVLRDEPSIFQEYFKKISRAFKGKQIYVAGDERIGSQLKFDNNISWLTSVDDLSGLLSHIPARVD